jgi:hypothetical protein
MVDSRRRFLAISSVASAALVFARRLTAQTGQRQTPGGLPKDGSDDNLPAKPSTKAMLEENDKDIKKSVEKLFQLASDLKEEVEKTDSSKTLSLAMVKKAEEIEKLAKDIKTRAKG